MSLYEADIILNYRLEIDSLRAQLTAERERAERAEAAHRNLQQIVAGMHIKFFPMKVYYGPDMSLDLITQALAHAKLDVERLDWLEYRTQVTSAALWLRLSFIRQKLTPDGNNVVTTNTLREAIDAAREKGEQKG